MNNKSILTGYTIKQKYILRDRLLADFELFCKFAFKCQTGGKFSVEQHHKILIDFAQDVIDGKITRGVVSLPPRFSKTAIFTVLLIARSYAGNPSSENIQTSFSDANVRKNAEDIMTIIEHPDFQELFGVKLSKRSTVNFGTKEGGTCFNRTTKGSLTGLGCGIEGVETFAGGLFIDDAIKPEDANSADACDTVNRIYMETLSSRPNTPIVPQLVIMQRLNENDLSGYLLKGGSSEKWHYLNVPALVDEDTGSQTFYDDLCEDYPSAIPYLYKLDIPELIERNIEQEYIVDVDIRDNYNSVEEYKEVTLVERLKGGLASLWAMKKTLKWLLAVKHANPRYFEAQYMQTPSGLTGGVFNTERFEYYDGFHTLDKKDIEWIRIYCDTALKAKTSADQTCFEAWAKTKQGNLYLVDGIADKWEAPELETNFIKFYDKIKALKQSGDRTSWRLEAAYIEDKASGTGLIQKMKRISGYNIKDIQRNIDKYSRACDILPEINTGRVFLLRNNNFSVELVHEAKMFTTNDKHKSDDLLDPMMDAIDDGLVQNNKRVSYRNM